MDIFLARSLSKRGIDNQRRSFAMNDFKSLRKSDPKSIFLEAIAYSSTAERSAYLDRTCDRNAALRKRVDGLLRAHLNSGRFLGGAPLGDESSDETSEQLIAEHPGSQIGPYKLLEQIGEGGFGVVFMAEQTQPIQRKVALKIIKPGMDTRQVIARFEAERQALALMDHPNIARVFDAGTTVVEPAGISLGRPYFVMELVKGVPITDYCDQQQLTVPKRLELIVQVCQAVEHAHQKGVIHRDLKPSNVLVAEYDGEPVPKVIDFGVAKATAGRLTDRTLFTAFGQLIGTFEYMSPEQARFNQLDVDTRSDIYSLGALLYELLTGSTPLEKERLRSANFDEILRIIGEEEPPLLRTRLSSSKALAAISARRCIEPAKLRRLVGGELNWIVMKCLEKDRNRRYATASALANDLARYLNDEPVEACPPSRSYRLKKFIRRNKAAVVAASAVVAALTAGLTLSSIGFIQARQQAQFARSQADRADREAKNSEIQAARSNEVSRFLQEMLAAAGPSVARGRDATLLREILDTTAKRVETDLASQPEVQGDLWLTLGNTCHDIGDYPRAISMLEHAVQSYRRALGDEHTKLALALGYLGKSQAKNYNIAAGHANAMLGLEMARQCGDRETLATCLYNAAVSFDVFVAPEAVSLAREAVELRRSLGDSDANRVALANCMIALAASLGDTDPAESENLAREALAIHTRYLGPYHFSIASDWHTLAWRYMDRHEFDKAAAAFRQKLNQYEKLDAKDHWGWLITQRHLLTALGRQGNWDEAESVALQAVKNDSSHAAALFNLGSLFAYLRRWPDAIQPLARAEELTRGKNEILHDQSVVRLAIVLLRSGHPQEYRDLRRKYFEQGRRTYNFETGVDVPLALWLLPAEGNDFERLCEFGDSVVDPEAYGRYSHWVDVLKALTEYRRGNFAAAGELSQRIVARDEDWTQLKALSLFLHALICARLHEMESAREAFAKGDVLVNLPDRDAKEDILWAWPPWSEAELLRAEAAELLGIAEPPRLPAREQLENDHANVRASSEHS
jgi:serine/threonine protein kinase